MPKQRLDEVRTLAIRLFNAGRRQKQKHGPHIWDDTKWKDLPSESVEVWDAVAMEAIRRLRRHNDQADPQPGQWANKPK